MAKKAKTKTGKNTRATATEVIKVKPIGAYLDHAVKVAGAKNAIDFLGRIWSWNEIGDMVDKATAGFRALGVKPGVMVGLHLPNTPYYVICFFAILRAGGTVVNYNPLYVERELAHQVKDSGTSIMVTMDLAATYGNVAPLVAKGQLQKLVVCPMLDILPGMKAVLFRLFKRRDLARIPANAQHVWFGDLMKMGQPAPPAPIKPETDIAVLQYTGGTTGVPKGATLTHANISANIEQNLIRLSSFDTSNDRILCVLPFFHVFGMSVVLLTGVAVGGELILLPRFEVQAVIKTMIRKRPTTLPGVPTMYIAINRAVAAMKHKPDLSSISRCMSGGAPLPREVKDEFERLSGCTLVEGYGLSETSPVVTANPFDGENRSGSIGTAYPGTKIEIRSLEDPHTIVKRGERGELCVRGPQVMQGYWKRPEDTAAVMVDGALRTGDVAYEDEDGYFYIVDRIKDLIICSGFKVFPRNVEDAIYMHPAVAECIVIGVPDSYRGHSPKAFVKLKDGASLSADELKKFLSTHLARHEMPHEIEFRPELPKTMIGKLSKKALQDEEEAKENE